MIALWIVSRTLGLPFAEGGEPEPFGVAGGVASLTEAWTAIVLDIYLAEPAPRWRAAAYGIGTALAASLTGLWWVAAGGGTFNDDPARLAVAQPWLVDWLVGAAGLALAAMLMVDLRAPLPSAWQGGLLRGLAGVMAVTGAALVWLTLPPTIGQNLECRYAPLSTVLAGSHARETEPIILAHGERIFVPAFELRACGSSAVTVERADPVTLVGHGATIEGVWLLPVETDLPDEGTAVLPAGAAAVPPGARIVTGQPRQLVVGLTATGAGDFMLGSVRLSYRTTDAGAFTFATQVIVCSGACE